MKPSPELIALWNKKLKNSGFVDIEDPVTGDLLGDASCSKPIYSKLDTKTGPATRLDRYLSLERYYRHARLFLHHYKHFKSPLEKTIWTIHSDECVGRGKIAAKLNVSHHTVRFILKDLKAIMLAWDPEEIT